MKPSTMASFACACGCLVAACSSVLGFEPLAPLPGEAPDETGEAGVDANALDASAAGETGSAAGDGSATPEAEATDGASEGGACDADLARDPKSCGRCNHDCLGAACTGGQCAPLKLADGLAIAEGLAVSDAHVFVAEFDLNRIAKFGKNALSPCLAPPLPRQCVWLEDQAHVFKPTAVALDATRVYWSNAARNMAHEIRACPQAGCGDPNASLLAKLAVDALSHGDGDDALPLDLILRDGQVFWPENKTGAIRSVSVTGGSVTTYLESASFHPLAIALGNSRIFFTDDSNKHPAGVQSVPRSGSHTVDAVSVVANTPRAPYGIGLFGEDDLYWSVPGVDDGAIQNAATSTVADGGAPARSLASEQIDPRAVLVDDTNVYWLSPGDVYTATGMVLYCPRRGCPGGKPIVLASQQRLPRHLAQDKDAIYWSNEGLASSRTYDGQVWKIAKP